MRQLPNVLTLLRLFSAPVLAWLIVSFRFREAVLLVVFAALTDWFDGYTARRLGTSGTMGIVLDPTADKIMLVTLYLALTYVSLIPVWLLILVLGRDLTIVIGAFLLRVLRNIRKFTPSMMGKVSTFFQIVFVLLVLLNAAFPVRVLFWLEMIALVLTTLFTAWSGAGYVQLGIRLARRAPQ